MEDGSGDVPYQLHSLWGKHKWIYWNGVFWVDPTYEQEFKEKHRDL